MTCQFSISNLSVTARRAVADFYEKGYNKNLKGDQSGGVMCETGRTPSQGGGSPFKEC